MLDLHSIRGARRWACTGAQLFDGEAVQQGTAVLIEDEQIAAVLPVAEIPARSSGVGGAGGTLLPGLIDMHVHFMRWEGPLYLGVRHHQRA